MNSFVVLFVHISIPAFSVDPQNDLKPKGMRIPPQKTVAVREFRLHPISDCTKNCSRLEL